MGLRRRLSMITLCCVAVAACGGVSASTTSQDTMLVTPQNRSLLIGVNRVSVALLDLQQNPLHVSDVSMQVVNIAGRVVETRPLQSIAAVYGNIPVYVGTATFPDVGQYEYIVHARRAGQTLAGHAFVTVSLHSTEVAVGQPAPAVRQPILGDPGVTLAMIDSGVPPDSWHTETVAQGIAQHRPMVLFFGDPAYCPSRTCGPTRDILEQLCLTFCSSMLFEHIETYYPAGPPGPHAHVNPAFTAFGLQTDPWIYFVNASGVVTDRYEGPVTLAELTQSAQGTLAGRVPAVTIS